MDKQHKKLERLYLFSEVARCLNFSLAADRLGISKGYLSEQIKALEQQLGVQLLVRTTRNVRLTSEGVAALEKLTIVRKHLLELERGLDTQKTEVDGRLRLTAPLMFANACLPKAFCEFRRRYPKVSFHLDISYERHDLSGSPFDIAIRSTREPPENMVAKELLTYEHWYCASPDYLSRHGVPHQPSDLSPSASPCDTEPSTELTGSQSHQCIFSSDITGWEFDGQSVPIDGPCVVNDPQFAMSLARAGEGIIRLPDYAAAEPVHRGEFMRLFPGYKTSGKKLFLVYPQTLNAPARLSVFMAFLCEYVLSI